MTNKSTYKKVGSYTCAYCGENSWNLRIAYDMSDKIYLIIRCSNPGCLKKIAEEMGIAESRIVWDEFDITGQGSYKLEEFIDSEEVN